MPTPLHPFAYDAFQHRAIELIEQDVSLFVSAPTGSGKTVIAEYVIDRALAHHQHVIYTAPVKALSNQKFRDFSARYVDQVGILTGDVTINATAPVLIMTTEIYRNTVLENPARLSRCAWVIFDEIHYLDDPERGTVWEEAILLTPESINILALSATIPNVEELATWIREVHQRPVETVVESRRPVPLEIQFQCQNAILKTHHELRSIGFLGREDWGDFRRRRHTSHRWHVRSNRLDQLLRHLVEHDRLPAIYFTFGRRRAEDLAWEASGIRLLTDDERAQLRRLYEELCGRFQLTGDRTAHAMAQLIERGVAYHHAGMLPTMKEVIERCFTSRLIKFIVTTETFALGINMPARSVVLDELRKRTAGRWDLIRHREFSQMSGRAGRRGMDEVGFVYLRLNPQLVTYPQIMRVLHGRPEPVHSRFNTAYATLLNLYRRHGRDCLSLFPKTLYAFQTEGARQRAGLEFMTRKLDLLESLGYLGPSGLTEKGQFASWLYGYELLLTELHATQQLEALNVTALAVLLAAIVYEPRPGLRLLKPHRLVKQLETACHEPLSRIHRAETAFRISPRAKAPQFQLSHAVEAWIQGAAFHRLARLCEVDDGEIVRYFRMTVQLLRQLLEAPAAPDQLRQTARQAFERINRDVVDAEQQLRLG